MSHTVMPLLRTFSCTVSDDGTWAPAFCAMNTTKMADTTIVDMLLFIVMDDGLVYNAKIIIFGEFRKKCCFFSSSAFGFLDFVSEKIVNCNGMGFFRGNATIV